MRSNSRINTKTLGVIIVVVVGVIAAGLGGYVYTNQLAQEQAQQEQARQEQLAQQQAQQEQVRQEQLAQQQAQQEQVRQEQQAQQEAINLHIAQCQELRNNWYNSINTWVSRKNSLAGTFDMDGTLEASRLSLGTQYNNVISRQCGTIDSDESWLNTIGMRLIR